MSARLIIPNGQVGARDGRGEGENFDGKFVPVFVTVVNHKVRILSRLDCTTRCHANSQTTTKRLASIDVSVV